MAVEKTLQTKSFSLEVENGVDKDGLPVYKKRTFSKVRLEAIPEDILAVAEAIEDVLMENTRDVYVNEVSSIAKDIFINKNGALTS